MEPLNKKERTKFIIRFSASFIIGILIILIPFYFLIKLPSYENAIQNQDYRNMQKQMNYQKEYFAVQIDSVKRMVNRYNIANQDIEKLNDQLASYLNKMAEPFINDTSWSGRMYKNISNLFFDLKNAKKDKIKSEKDLKDCKQDLDKAKEEAKKSKDTMGG
jgi:hypothetical protein